MRKLRKAAVYTVALFAEAAREGGLRGYGPKQAEGFRQLWSQLDRILKGTKPNDFPVAQPTKFELGINLITAKAESDGGCDCCLTQRR